MAGVNWDGKSVETGFLNMALPAETLWNRKLGNGYAGVIVGTISMPRRPERHECDYGH
jgi:hypothetical protein